MHNIVKQIPSGNDEWYVEYNRFSYMLYWKVRQKIEIIDSSDHE